MSSISEKNVPNNGTPNAVANTATASAIKAATDIATSDTTSTPTPPLCAVTTEYLASHILPPVNYLVTDVIGSGLSIIAGEAKIGKSLFVFHLASAIASGETFLGHHVAQGRVLYFAIEDTLSRIQHRMSLMGLTPSDRCHITTERRTLDDGLPEAIRLFVAAHPDTVLVIIDTLEFVRCASRRQSYANDVHELSVLKELCNELGISIICVHHTNQNESSKGISRVSGTMGLVGTADTIVIMSRGDTDGLVELSYIGKDVGAGNMSLRFNGASLSFAMATPTSNLRHLPRELEAFCEAVAVTGGFEMANDEFGLWLYENIGVGDLTRFKREARKYAKELAAHGVTIASADDRRTAGQRYTRVAYVDQE